MTWVPQDDFEIEDQDLLRRVHLISYLNRYAPILNTQHLPMTRIGLCTTLERAAYRSREPPNGKISSVVALSRNPEAGAG